MLNVLLKMIFLVWIAMAAWVYLVHFASLWVISVVIFIEIILAIFAIGMEVQARQVQGASGWMSFIFLSFNLYLALALGVIRVMLWAYQKIWVGRFKIISFFVKITSLHWGVAALYAK